MSGAVAAMWMVNPAFEKTVYAQRTSPAVDPPGEITPPYHSDNLTDEESVNVFVYDRNNRGVVNITTRTVRSDGLFMLERSSEGARSGAVIDQQGHILTNYHVIEDARQIKVSLFDGKTCVATLVGGDPVPAVSQKQQRILTSR